MGHWADAGVGTQDWVVPISVTGVGKQADVQSVGDSGRIIK